MIERNYYDEMMSLLEEPYCRFANRDELIEAFSVLLTPAQAEIFPCFPDFSFRREDPPGQPLSVIRQKIRPELLGDLEQMVEDMEEKKFLLCVGQAAGEKLYMRNYMFSMALSFVYTEGHPLQKPLIHWFHNVKTMDDMRLGFPVDKPLYVTMPHEGALTGDRKYGKISMNVQIPDTREIIPYDLASKAIEQATAHAVRPCICRQVTSEMGKKTCNYPMDYCMILNEPAEATIASKEGVEVTKEEMLELLKKCRDMGLVQSINNANHPYSICNCCRDCCLLLDSLAKGETKLSKPSRFVAYAGANECIKCGICTKACPMEAIRMTIAGALVIPRQCIGCGVCVSKCPKGVLTLLRKNSNNPKGRDIVQEKRPYI